MTCDFISKIYKYTYKIFKNEKPQPGNISNGVGILQFKIVIITPSFKC